MNKRRTRGLRAGFSRGTPADKRYEPPDDQIVSEQHLDERRFMLAKSVRDEDYKPTEAEMSKLEAVVRAYRELLASLNQGEYGVTGLEHDEGWASVDMSEWPRGRGFPPSVERLLKQYDVWAFD